MLVMIFWIGLYPKPFFALMTPAVDKLLGILQAASVAMH
jgi:NADH:ubiquinone oxidoreductase subunit 4 (subunit M)